MSIEKRLHPLSCWRTPRLGEGMIAHNPTAPVLFVSRPGPPSIEKRGSAPLINSPWVNPP
jgi:hypothetical protein